MSGAESIYAFGVALTAPTRFFRNPCHIPEKTRPAQKINPATCVTCMAWACVAFSGCNGLRTLPVLEDAEIVQGRAVDHE